MKIVSKTSITAIYLLFISMTNIWSGDIDILLDKLVEKNIISGLEAHEIRYETQEEVKKEISLGINKTLPFWLQNITIGWDIRMRYQKDENKNYDYKRERFRYRIRWFINSKVGDNLFIYSGFATGENDDSRSTNQTLTGNFSKKNIYLDYGYMEYYITPSISINIGRIKQAICYTNDMLWDGDINQEGGLLKIEKSFNINYSNSISIGRFVIKENKDKKDLYLNYITNTLSWKSDDNFKKMNITSSYYNFENLKGNTTFYQTINSISNGKYIYHYKPFVIDVNISKNIEEPLNLYKLNINYLSIFSSYVINTAISKDKKGWIVGFRIGQEKVSGSGDFQIVYSRRWIERDSWIDAYPDSDFYGGTTDVKGDRYTLSYGISRDLILSLNYFDSKPIKRNKKPENIIQIDLVAKF